MCGIFGFVGRRDAAERLDLEAVTDSLRHRGPDGHGLFRGVCRRPDQSDLACAMAHTRLAILDLTAAADQPMSTSDGRYTMVYNGEVYNFADIRRDLEAEGTEVRSTGDTEVVLKAYARWGEDAVQRFRGMFALAIWDAVEGRLFAVRDRLGIKPLYYAVTPAGMAFASEVNALLAAGVSSRRLSVPGLVGYLRFGSVQEPDTLVEGIRALPAARMLHYEDGRASERQYWTFPPPQSRQVTFGEAVEEIRPVLADAVRLRLVSDVPLGVFLSGGIDSSVITGLAARALDHPVHTFTVTFDEHDYNEAAWASEVAAEFGCDHHQVHLPAARAVGEIDDAMAAFDQPSADGLNTWFVSKAAREAGLRVALSGLGGDEVFAGYGAFRTFGPLRKIGRFAGLIPARAFRTLDKAFERLGGSPRVSRALSIAAAGGNGRSTYAAIRCMFTDSQILRLVSPALRSAVDEEFSRPYEALSESLGDANPVNEYSRRELTSYLRNTLLHDTDIMSMSHGFEVRVPLIDHVLVEKTLTLPGGVKLRPPAQKALLVNAAPPLPDSVSRRPKMGFLLPLDAWFRGPLRVT